ncbi:hypothetical protein HDV00_008291 [Rhizophlyctis rosea]|nr:hypothetical protein HDV00_008291 [Rhizophlyctis rosea]
MPHSTKPTPTGAHGDEAELEIASTSTPPSAPPIIIVAAHEDDITIGMAGTLHRLCQGDQEDVLNILGGIHHKEDTKEHFGVRRFFKSLMHSTPTTHRRPVYVLLTSNGYDEKLIHIFSGKQECTWHKEKHNFGFSPEQTNWARKIEVSALLQRAGVDKTFIANDGEGLDNRLAETNATKYTNEMERILRIYAHQFPGATWFLISGAYDPINGDASQGPHPAHKALWDVAHRLRVTDDPSSRGFAPSRTFFYRVYEYMRGEKAGETARIPVELDSETLLAKQKLLDEHKLYVPEAYRLATGYHSYPELIDKSYLTAMEWFDRMEVGETVVAPTVAK